MKVKKWARYPNLLKLKLGKFKMQAESSKTNKKIPKRSEGCREWLQV